MNALHVAVGLSMAVFGVMVAVFIIGASVIDRSLHQRVDVEVTEHAEID